MKNKVLIEFESYKEFEDMKLGYELKEEILPQIKKYLIIKEENKYSDKYLYDYREGILKSLSYYFNQDLKQKAIDKIIQEYQVLKSEK